jgi:hypothetical protein
MENELRSRRKRRAQTRGRNVVGREWGAGEEDEGEVKDDEGGQEEEKYVGKEEEVKKEKI